MASKIGVYNAALVHIGERTLASLTEAREPRRVIDAVWTQEVTFCLEAGQWNFATRTVQIDSSASVAPAFGFTYAFTKPSDWLRTIGLAADENLTTPLNEYQDEAGYWYGDVDPLYVRYISSSTAYGFDLSLWPSRFTKYAEYHLAATICERLTQNATKADWLAKKAKEAKREALSTDAMDSPMPTLPAGKWAQARVGGPLHRNKLNLPDT